MDELLQQVVSRLRGMWHRRWIGLGVAWLVAIVGVTIAFRIPERYEASARVYVDTQSLLRPLMEGLAIQPNLDQQVALMSRTLISRPNVEKLIRMADLDLGVMSPGQREGLIDNLMSTLQVSGNVTNNLYIISYRHPSPEKAKQVVQSLLSIFVESSLGDKRLDTRSAVKFIDDQIKTYEDNLQAAESRLKQFRLKYLGVTGQAGATYFDKLSKAKDDVESARLELHAAEESRDAYKRELSGETPTFIPEQQRSVGASSPELDARIGALKAKLDEMLRQYTDQHPDVVGTRRVIKQLEDQRAQEQLAIQRAANAGGRQRDTSVDTNPVFQQMKVSLADAEANVASLRAKLSSYENQFAQLKAAAQLVPQAEAEYAQLNRDYDVQKKTYETLLSRKEAATMGVGVQDTGGAQFRVIDPPRVSPEPVAPTRFSSLGMAMLLSLVAGLAASFLANEIVPTVADARSLREVTTRPILGMVSMLTNDAWARKARRRSLQFAAAFSALLATFMGVFALAFMIARAA